MANVVHNGWILLSPAVRYVEVLTVCELLGATSFVYDRYLHLYPITFSVHGHVARLPAEDPAHRILFYRDPRGWFMPRGRPHASWLRKVESCLKDMGMAGLASAWAMARWSPI